MVNGPLPTSGGGNLAAGSVKNDDDLSRPPLLSLFFAFQIIGGHIGFPILLAVSFALGNASSRHPLFINFCIIWVISSAVFCMLLYAGYDTGPEPPFTICAIQASLVYAMPIMAAVSLWAMVFHLWLCLRGAMSKIHWLCSRERLWGLIVLPYVTAIPFIIFPAVIARTMPDKISRRQTDFGFHCSTHFRPLRTTVAASVAILLVLLLVWEFLVGWICYKNWKAVRGIRVHGWTSKNLFARIAIFTLYIMVGIGACGVAIAFPSNRFRILFQASLPTAAFLLFGSRPNLWKRKPSNRTYTPPSRGTQPESSVDSRVALSDTSPVGRQEITRSSSNSSQGSATTLVPPTRSDSSSTDGDEMRQIEHASTIRSSSLQSVPPSASALEKGSGALPALPCEEAVPNAGGTTQWLPPRRGTSISESVR